MTGSKQISIDHLGIAVRSLDQALEFYQQQLGLAVSARETVVLKLPAEQNGVARKVDAQALESKGDNDHGLTSARFSGAVEAVHLGGVRSGLAVGR